MLEEIYHEGVQIGVQKTVLSMAAKLLDEEKPREYILKFLEVTEEQLKEIEQKIQSEKDPEPSKS
jgi:hypothetical protein